MSPRFAYVYFMHDDPDRVRTTIPRHVAHWHGLVAGYTGGPFVDRSGGLITFRADNDEQAQQAVATDPFIREGSFRRTGSSSGRPSEICAEAAMTDRLGGDRLAGADPPTRPAGAGGR